MRAPTASYTALATAAMTPETAPSPTSLAPNGPCGSWLWIMPLTMAGVSWVMGIR